MPIVRPDAPFSPGLGGPLVTSLALRLGPSAAQNVLGQHVPDQVLRPPPAATRVTSSVPTSPRRPEPPRALRLDPGRLSVLAPLTLLPGSLPSHRPLLGPQARSLPPELESPGLVPCSPLVMLLTQRSSAALTASGGSTRCPNMSPWLPNEHVT